MKNQLSFIIFSFFLSFSSYSQTDLILVDFGSSPSPLPWNNLSNPKDGQLNGLINSNGLSTNISLMVIDSFSYINTNGTQMPNPNLGILSSASEDSFFGNAVLFSNDLQPTGAIQLSNLEVDKLYNISIFSSRIATDNRETQYEITGLTMDTAYLNVSDNTDSLVLFSAYPASDGTIEIKATTGPNNDNGFGFFYLGALKIEYPADSILLPSLDLVEPNGGEYWQVGKTVKIEWAGTIQSTSTLEYSTDNGSNWNLIESIPAFQKSFDWVVPNTPSNECLVRVTTDSLQDESDAVFEISSDTTSCPIVVIGSSTAVGTGVSNPENAWVNRFRTFVSENDTRYPIINLAKGGYTTYHLLPSGNPLAGNVGITIDTERNITKALSFNPSGIIINLPSNDAANLFPVQDQLTNFELMVEAANLQGAKTWVCTTQPRNFNSPAQILLQQEMRDSIFAIYGNKAIDFWSDLADTNGLIVPQFNSGDGVHLNDAGHQILFDRVVARNIPDSICGFLPVGIEDLSFEKNMAINVFPNPFESNFQIEFNNTSFDKIEFYLYDIYGRVLYQKKIENVLPGEISVSIQPPQINRFRNQPLLLKVRGFENGRIQDKMVRLIGK